MCRCRGVCSGTVTDPVGVEWGMWGVRQEVSVGRGHILTGSVCHAKGSGFHCGGVTEQVGGHGQRGMLDHCGTCRIREELEEEGMKAERPVRRL